MPVYAPAPAFAGRGGHPNAMLVIVSAHVALIAAVMSAKMDLPRRIFDPPIIVEPIPIPPEPTVEPQLPEPRRQPQDSKLDQVPAILPVPQPDAPRVDPGPDVLPDLAPPIGPGLQPQPPLPEPPQPRAEPVRTGPRSLTPAHMVEPPYPPSKLAAEEEAALRLKLSIDERGRVVAVDPVGSVDRSFFQAARRHILANWRYKPAAVDGKPVPSSTVITLRFTLED